ncbi:MAG: hypothetical protein KTR18_14665 [Acidiferrobacterales bacterium]|nr:hypothetical protein [Acidiferrobacterales bacterium]
MSERETLETIEDIETSIAKSLFRLLKWFNLMEINLGLSISHLLNEGGSTASYNSVSKMSLDRKLTKFLDLISEDERLNIGKIDLDGWRARVNTARLVRNAFVHGYWEILPINPESPISLQLPPWAVKSKENYSGSKFSAIDVEAAADDMGRVFGEFMHFRKKLGV